MSSQLEACIKQLTMINEKLNRQANALDEIENEVEAVMHSISAVYNVPVPPLIPVHIENLTYRHAEVHADTNFQVPLSRLSKRASIRRSNQLVLAAVGNARRNDTGDVSTDVRSSVLMDSQIEIAMSNYAYEDATSVPSKSNSTRKTSVISRVITKTKSRGSQKSFRGSSSGHKLEKQTDLAITPEPQEINDPFKESKPAKRRGSMLNSTNISSLSDGEMQPSISRRTSTRKKNAPIDSSNNSSNEDSSKQTRRRPSMLADLLNDKNSKLVTGSNSSSDVPFTNSDNVSGEKQNLLNDILDPLESTSKGPELTTNIVNKVAPITPVKPLNFALLGVQRNLSTPLRTPTYEAYRLKMTHETNVFLEASHSNSSIGANILLEEKEPVLKSNLKRDITDNLESTAELKRVEISTIESEILDSTKLHLENEKFMNPDKNAFFSKSDHEGSVKSIVKEAPIQFSQPQTAIVIAEVPQKNIVKFSFLNVFFLSAAYTDFGSSLSKNDREFSLKLNSEGKLGNGINRLSHFIVYWDFLISLAYFAAIAIIPITASFSTYIGHEFIGFCYFLSAVYFLDVIINLFTVREKNIIATVDESRITYLKSRFIFDAVSMIPWFSIAYLYNIKFSEEFSVIYMIRIYNLYKILMENAIYKKIANKLDEKYGLGSSFFSMFGMGSLLFVFLHLHACSYFLVGKMIEFSSTSWISLNNSTDILSKSLSDQYSWAFFAAIGNTFPVTGYRPSSVVEKWITIFLILIGATLYAVLVGTISSFSFGLDSSGRLYNEKIEEVQEYLNFKQLDDKIKTRVKKYYELKYNGKYFDEKQIMSELNISLRQEIAVHICRKLIEKVPFLNRKTGDGRDESFARSISTALEPVYFIDGDRIFEQGEIGNEMYFVYSGVLDVEVNGKIVTQLKEGAFFGEVALLGQVPRTASITARRNTCLYSLDRETLEDILIDYEDVSLNMQKIYEERAKRAKIEQESRSDEQKRAMSLRVMQPKRISTDRRESIQPSNRQASRRPTMTQSKSSINAEPVNFFAKRASTISGKI